MNTRLEIILLGSVAMLSAHAVAAQELVDLGTHRADDLGFGTGQRLSADASTVVGQAENAEGDHHAFRFTNSGRMQDLGTLRSDNAGSSSANGVSANGLVIVGDATNDAGDGQAYRWTSNGGMQGLGTLRSDNLGYSTARALSADGETVVGSAESDVSNERAFRWTVSDGMQDLGTLRADDSGFSRAVDVSGDGAVVVGSAEGDTLGSHAFRWTDADGMQDLGTLRADNSGISIASKVSDDGSAVIGAAQDCASNFHAFRWTDGDGMQDLGTLRADNSGFSTAGDVSADGEIVVGLAEDDAGNEHAFRWTDSDGMQDLGTLRADNSGRSSATAVSTDGNTIVGNSDNEASESQAFRWTSTDGMQGLGTLRADNSGSSQSIAVSSNGDVVIGLAENDAGSERAFIWGTLASAQPDEVIGGNGVMVDHLNTLDQVYENSVQQIAAGDVLNSASLFALGQEVDVRHDDDCVRTVNADTCRPPVAVRVSLGGGGNSDSIDVALAGVTASVALSANLSLGGYVGLGTQLGDLDGFGIDGNFRSYGAYLRQEPATESGLTWKVAYGQAGADADIRRSMALPNTEVGTGQSNLTSRGALAEVGYRFTHKQMRITPFGRLIRTEYKRDAYSEANDIAFPVSYDALEQTATIAAAGIELEVAAGADGTLRFTGGVEFDLDRSDNPVTGTSRIPGMTDFAISGAEVENSNRGFASLRYTHALATGSAIEASLGVRQDPYVNAPTALVALGYTINF